MIRILILTTGLLIFGESAELTKDLDSSKSLSREKRLSITDTQSNTILDTKSNDKSIKTSIDLSLYLINKLDLSCTESPRNLNSFGLGYVSHGIIDTNRKNFLENAGLNSLYLKDIGIDDSQVKSYMTCLINAGALLAQASINFSKIGKEEMTEPEFERALQRSLELSKKRSIRLSLVERQATKIVEQNDCRFFNNNERIQCGNVSLEMSSTNSNYVTYLNHVLFGSASDFYGVSTILEIALSESDQTQTSVASSEDTSMSKTSTATKNSSSKKSISTSKIIPGVN